MKKIDIKELGGNVVSMFDDSWCLITAGDGSSYNTMTASWGAMGELWNKDVCFCFIRPQRHTHPIAVKASRLSLSVLPETYREALRFCGTKSGRDYDKFKETGLTVAFDEHHTPYVGEADTVLLAKKLYVDEIREDSFLDPELLKNYKEKDYHTVFVCEIEDVLQK